MALYDFGAIAMNLGSGNPPDPVKVVHISADYFKVFGVSPMAGRSFSEAEDLPRGPAVAVIGYGLWQSRFGGASDVLGRPLLLSGTPYSIVGIMPNGFQAAPEADLWIPLQADPNSTNQGHYLVGRPAEARRQRRRGAGADEDRRRAISASWIRSGWTRRKASPSCRCARRRRATCERRCWCCSARSRSCC